MWPFKKKKICIHAFEWQIPFPIQKCKKCNKKKKLTQDTFKDYEKAMNAEGYYLELHSLKF
jgi:hypothetical protein